MQPTAGAGRGARGDLVAGALLFVLVTLFFADVLFTGASLIGRDLPTYHFPMKATLRALIRGGEFPWWTPLIHGGQPVAANPAYETFYPLQLPILLPDYAQGFALHVVLHVYLAAGGMYLLARRLTASPLSAFLAAMLFALSAPYISLVGTLPFLFSVAWMPVVFFFAHRFHRGRRGIDFAGAALALAMQALIGEPFVFGQTVLLLVAAALVVEQDEWRRRARRGGMVVLLVIAACGVAAVQLLPAVDFARHSARAIPLPLHAAASWSFPPSRAAELFFPDFAGDAADEGEFFGAKRLYGDRPEPFVGTLYLGLLSGALIVAGFVLRFPWWRFTAVAVALSGLVAAGIHTPLFRMLYESGLLRSLRYPEKFILSAFFVLTLFAAYALDRLLAGEERVERAVRATVVITGVAAAIVSLLHFLPHAPSWFASFWTVTSQDAFDLSRLGWLTVVGRCLLLGLLLVVTRRMELPRRAALLVAFTLLDVVMISARFVDRTSSEFYREAPALLRPAGSPTGRMLHLAFEKTGVPAKLPAEYATWLSRNNLVPYGPSAWGRETVFEDDFDYTMLVPVRLLLDAADAARRSGDPSWPLAFMAISNADTLVVRAEPEQIIRSLRGPPEEITSVRLLKSPLPAPRYYFAAAVRDCRSRNSCIAALREALEQPVALTQGVAFTPDPGRIFRVSEAPSSIELEVESEGRAFLVASHAADKYWSATVDGKAVPIVRTNLAYQGVVVERGRHVVAFLYRNPLVTAGAALSAASLLALALVSVRLRSRA